MAVEGSICQYQTHEKECQDSERLYVQDIIRENQMVGIAGELVGIGAALQIIEDCASIRTGRSAARSLRPPR